MAATVDKYFLIGRGSNPPETVVELSSLDNGVADNISHYGPSGVQPHRAEMEVITRPNDGSTVQMQHARSSDSTTNNTASLRFYTDRVGGSLLGAVVRVHFYFNQIKSGGITAT